MSVSISHSSVSPPLAVLGALDLVRRAGVRIDVEPHQQSQQPTITIGAQTCTGSGLILRYLGRAASSASSSSLQLYGANNQQATEIDFFLDLATLLTNKDTLSKYATQLEAHLEDRTTLVGDVLTIADLFVFEQITANPRWANFLKTSTASFPNVLRWHALVAAQPCLSAVFAARTQQAKAKADKAHARSTEGAGFDVDLPGAVDGQVVTRFPPEPSGFLHIGHAKAAMLNDAIAKKFNGKMILRFDDTNPKKEKEEYVDSIMADLQTLGVKHHSLTHTSDYFDLIAGMATKMLETDKAYVDDTPVEEMRTMRMEGIASKARTQSVAENLRLWAEMQAGSPEGLKCCMRAKIDITAPNKAMRDPVIYRCNIATPHHRTGTKYKAYPTYDFACPIVDSIEGVTHCLRTNEYRDRNQQFFWMIDALGLKHRPFIRDYSRLNFVYTVLSKRKLQWFVESKLVDGWNDPRFPTIQGILRRGMTVEALREFILGQGFSMSTNMMEWDKIWTINKRVIDPVAPRYTGISQDNQAIIDIPELSSNEVISVDLHPKNPKIGTKAVSRSNKIVIEQDDAKLIKEGEEVTLMNWGNIILSGIQTGADGTVLRMTGKLNLGGDPKTTSKKLTWLDASPAVVQDLLPLSFIELDTLVTVPKVEGEMNFESVVNPTTKYYTAALGEPAMRSVQKGAILQINRRGFFIVDQLAGVGPSGDTTPMQLIFIPDGKTKAMSTLSTKVDKAKLVGGGAQPVAAAK